MKFLFLIFLLSPLASGQCQSIESLLRKDWIKEDSSIAKIMETRITFLDSKIETTKSTYVYDRRGFLTSREDYLVERGLKTKVSFYYDANFNLLARTIENWIGEARYQRDSLRNNYGPNGLFSIVFYGKNNKMTSYAQVKNNDDLLPIELLTYKADSSLIGREKVNYDLVNNRAFTFIYNSSGRQVGDAIEIVVDLNKEKERMVIDKKYDVHNQLIEYRSKRCLSCLDEVTFQTEYKYDVKGNWVRQDRYVTDKKRIKKSTTKRTIAYRD